MKRYKIVNNALGWLCFVVAAATYLLTLEPTASFWDCPEFIAQGTKLEVGHPPGNPIFMLAARFFVTLFGGGMSTAAVAVNSMSALLSAATILLLFWTITHLVRRLIVRDDATDISLRKLVIIMGSGLCGALAYTWSDTFWFSAVEGEVYAFSSFCTALVFWLILKWENRADEPHSDRYLVLIAYVIGVSIAVHLLNLLCIPAIGLVFYYRKWKTVNAKGSLIALGLSCVLVGAILYGLVPGFMKVAQWFELFFVNSVGLGYNMGVLIYAVVLVGVLCWAAAALYRQTSAAAIRWSCLLGLSLSGLPFIGPWWAAVIIIAAIAVWLFMAKKLPVRVLNVAMLSVLVIFVGYSSYALLLIRATANTPMNQNAPDNVFALASYMSREQYGDRPLFYGVAFAEELETVDGGDGNLYVRVNSNGVPATRVLDGYLRDERGGAYNDAEPEWSKLAKTSPLQSDEYVQKTEKPHYRTVPDMKMLFTRIYSTDEANARHVSGYKGWAEYATPDLAEIPQEVRARWAEAQYVPLYEVAPYLHHQSTVTTAVDATGAPVAQTTAWKPGFGVNLRYFVNYQLNHMYWRYFMWNFAGRQNDIQGNGEPHLGNWISGIPVIDNARLGDQSLLPDEFGKGNKGHNVFYMLPLLLGIIGLLWQALRSFGPDGKRGIEQFWVVFFLFFMTGIAIVLYLNQTPGQPRERDYAFAGSFYAYAIWIGIGVAAIAYLLRDLARKLAKGREPGEGPKWPTAGVAVAIGIAVPLQMVSQTWDDHDRSGRYTARDFGMNYLNSLDKDAIIFTNGDNDTFPLWYAQEVEGVRRDVRVVNLSYLTTGWYANQLRHPSYEGKAIETYTGPNEYAYDRLAYSFVVPQTDSLVSAADALAELRQSDASRFGAHYLTTPHVVFDVDTAGAVARFGINPADTTQELARYFDAPETNLRNLGSGMTLSRLLSMDMIAHSLANGWDRPIYFASTVPSSYYLGLRPYLSATGMAYEVTPFRDAPVNVNAAKAYENAFSRFRWGGLDVPGADVYLDETVRRMVASTRSGLYSTVEDLLADADAPASDFARSYAREHGQPEPATQRDMARNLLDLIVEKMPAELSPWDGMMDIYVAAKYYDLWLDTGRADDLQKAQALLDAAEPRYAQLVRWASSLSSGRLNQIGRNEEYALQYLGMVVGMKNQIDVVSKLAAKPGNEELLKAVRERLPLEYALRVYPLLYVDGYTEADLYKAGGAEPGADVESLPAVVYEGVVLLRAHEAAGVDPLQLTSDVERRYGIDRNAWGRIL